MIKAVLDTNVFISALFWKGSPHEVVRHGLCGAFVILISDSILAEVKNTLVRKFDFPVQDAEVFSEVIVLNSVLVKPKARLRVVDADSSDNKIFECAVVGEADYIVSGDKHVLGIKKYDCVRTISPQKFLKLL